MDGRMNRKICGMQGTKQLMDAKRQMNQGTKNQGTNKPADKETKGQINQETKNQGTNKPRDK